ncbi:hypothetical protein GFS24_22715 [Chitinophaga sp. SYP-B3965]|uniref:hypothetical protein n=1 Tax=Chitinophaga sp. SYP-B3965 TaxID=2663120 RepID=UPI001299A18C|nr:hypothetical protein [Chitinophaga sp. SYP-B3965]MRG47951.1 hypothetical protein [Chitinophaga sp. SYP-B3965]
MNNSLEINYIKKCLVLIETRLNWGASDDWTSYDFEKLSEVIQERTGVTLSITTLKRLWGKLKYDNIPATTTLNTLAKFAGYEDWREFKQQVQPGGIEIPPQKSKPRRKWMYGLLGLLPLLLVLYLALLSNRKSATTINKADYTFSSNKTVTEGVPNSVIFSYDATAAGEDSVFITQTWDRRRKVRVPANEKAYSAIYYMPGYFRAKLIVGDQIVKEHDLMISSGGWLALIEQKSDVPLYFKKEEFQKNSGVVVSEALLSAYQIPLQPSPPVLRIYNVQDLGIKNDHFTFETTLKSGYDLGTAACQRVEVLILCKSDVFIIPLSAKGCVGDLSLVAAGVAVQSSKADLSKFGCDLDQWVKVKVEAKDKRVRFFVNGEEAYALTFPNAPTDIVGVQYRFSGTGAVKDTRFMKDKRVIDL